jgi:large subunit ribosomal protein L35
MPKMKTRRSAAKRFAVTGTGRIRHRRSGRVHLKVGKKPATRLRRLAGTKEVSRGDRKRVRRMLNS